MHRPAFNEIRHGLAGRDMFTLRPAGAVTRALIGALRAEGARAFNLSPLRLIPVATADFIEQSSALDGASHWLFTSPAAVHVSARLAKRAGTGLFHAQRALARAAAAGRVFAPGPGTASALAKLGIAARTPARRFDSEGLLALPGLAAPLDGHLVLVGAPEGRGLLQPVLQERGAQVSLLHVYRRRPCALPARRLAALCATPGPLLIVSSQAMLDALLAQLDEHRSMRLSRRAQLVVSSERLREHAASLGFHRISVARSAQPDHLRETALAMAKMPHHHD